MTASDSDIVIRQQVGSTEFDDDFLPLIAITTWVRKGSTRDKYRGDRHDHLDSRMYVTECPASISADSYGAIGDTLDSHSQSELESKAVIVIDAFAGLYL